MKKQLQEIIRGAKQLLAIHHWDADGIASAAIIVEENSSTITYCPPIGEYEINEIIINELKEILTKDISLILILDWNIPFNHADLIRDKLGIKVAIIDHHYKSEKPKSPLYYNPVALGDKEENWPSTTWVLTKILGRNIDFKALIGLFGDLEEKALELKFYENEIKPILSSKEFSIEELLRASKMLNLCGRYGNREIINEITIKLCKANSLTEILNDSILNFIYGKIENEIQEILNKNRVIETNSIVIKKFSSPYSVTSEIVRRLAKMYSNKIIIAVNQHDKYSEIYIRRGFKLNISLTPLINRLANLGLRAGGKRSVIGIRIKNESIDDVLKLVLKNLGDENFV